MGHGGFGCGWVRLGRERGGRGEWRGDPSPAVAVAQAITEDRSLKGRMGVVDRDGQGGEDGKEGGIVLTLTG